MYGSMRRKPEFRFLNVVVVNGYDASKLVRLDSPDGKSYNDYEEGYNGYFVYTVYYDNPKSVGVNRLMKAYNSNNKRSVIVKFGDIRNFHSNELCGLKGYNGEYLVYDPKTLAKNYVLIPSKAAEFLRVKTGDGLTFKGVYQS